MPLTVESAGVLLVGFLGLICLLGLLMGRIIRFGTRQLPRRRPTVDEALAEIDWTFPSRTDARPRGSALPPQPARAPLFNDSSPGGSAEAA